MSPLSLLVRGVSVAMLLLLVSCGGGGGGGGGGTTSLNDPSGDRDGDGVADTSDNCPDEANADQGDDDGDGSGNACDQTPGGLDFDRDGVSDGRDNCPRDANSDQSNRDGDRFGDECDDTPDGPDGDRDTRPDSLDNCPFVPNVDQADDDGDGTGNACETVDPDVDGDGVDNERDNCPTSANTDQVDADGDGLGDPCDPTPFPDGDRDGVIDTDDNCQATANEDQLDTDRDGEGDACDDTPRGPDRDGDGVPDANDNCPAIVNADQLDRNGDGRGDACTEVEPVEPDEDGDGVPDTADNCPAIANPEQRDIDADSLGDACDPSRIAVAVDLPPVELLKFSAGMSELVAELVVDDGGEPTTTVMESAATGWSASVEVPTGTTVEVSVALHEFHEGLRLDLSSVTSSFESDGDRSLSFAVEAHVPAARFTQQGNGFRVSHATWTTNLGSGAPDQVIDYRYELDPSGGTVRERSIDGESRERLVDIDVDEAGRVVRETYRYSLSGDGADYFVEYVHGEHGPAASYGQYADGDTFVQVHEYRYDERGRFIAYHDVLKELTEYTLSYVADGPLVSEKVLSTGGSVRYRHDERGRRVEADLGDGALESFTYDAVGNVVGYRVEYRSGAFTSATFDYEYADVPVYNLWIRRQRYAP